MKKSVKKTLSTILALTVIGGSMMGATSCGKEENDLNTLYVSIINKGYGTEWMNTLMGKFLQSDAKYANYDYEIINSYDDETTKTQVESGAEYCNYDLVFHGGDLHLQGAHLELVRLFLNLVLAQVAIDRRNDQCQGKQHLPVFSQEFHYLPTSSIGIFLL